MLWVGLCLLLLQTVAADNQVCEIYKGAQEHGFKSLALVGLSQNLPDSTVDELAPLIDEAKTLAVTCCSDTPTADCERDPADLFQRAVCSSESLAEKNDLKDCCAKSGTERTECFVDHKTKIPRDLSLQPEVAATADCENFKKDNKSYIDRFIFSFSKSHTMLQPQMVLGIAKGYGDVMTSCCAEDVPQTCFDTKKAAFQTAVRNHVTRERSLCLAHKKYGERVLKAKKLVEYSQKLPQATQEELHSIVERILATIGPCCQGNMVKCIKEKKKHIDEVCATESLISRATSLAECCKVDVLSRGGCFIKMKANPKPDGLSEHFDMRAEVTPICTTFTRAPDDAMAKVIYEVSRRHPEASEGTILRYSKEVEQAFLKCCNKADHADCVATAMERADLEKAITDNTAVFTKQCDKKTALGRDGFEKITLVRYTTVMPQADFKILNAASERVAALFHECCMEDAKAPCLENKMTDLIDAICNDNEAVNPEIADCCNQSYSARRPCISSMKAAAFQAPALDTKSLSMGPEVCTLTGKDLLHAEKKLLYNVVRQKTTITEEQLTAIRTDYQTFKTKCCGEADQAACFTTGAPTLMAKAAELASA